MAKFCHFNQNCQNNLKLITQSHADQGYCICQNIISWCPQTVWKYVF